MKRIKIWHDSIAENPWEAWDCMMSLMVNGGRNFTSKDYSEGTIMEEILAKATKGRVLRHQLKIANILEIDLNWYYTSDEKYDELYSEIRNCNLDQTSELLDLFKIPNLKYTSRGYSQGDAVEVLLVQTQNWKTDTGRKFSKKVEEEEFESAKKLYNAWAWGDTYGFNIEEKKKFTKTYTDGTVEEGEEWVELDSCGGFYGNDFMTNSMADHIPEELREQLKNYDLSDITY
jgi:hypothetical protein